MEKLIASSPRAEVLGESILRYVNCLEHGEVKPILSRYGLDDIQPLDWYPHQTILDVLRDIEQQSESMVSIGIKLMEGTVALKNAGSIPAVFDTLGAVYQMHHRNIAEKGWTAELLEPGYIQVVHDSPYPEDLAYGMVWGAVSRFRPTGVGYMVVLTESDSRTVYDVKWNIA